MLELPTKPKPPPASLPKVAEVEPEAEQPASPAAAVATDAQERGEPPAVSPDAQVEGEDVEMAVVEETVRDENGVVVDGLLRAATCCLHCGGRWMKYL